MMATWRVCLACTTMILALTGGRARGATLVVDLKNPTGLKSIQKAIDQANNFDTVVVHPGIYSENIDFRAKPITVRSLDPNDPMIVSGTIIDGNGKTVVQFISGETPYSVLRGFTLRNGEYGIVCKNDTCRPKILQCQIYSNNLTGILGGAGTIAQCDVHDNGQNGLMDCAGTIRNCVIAANRVNGIYGLKGALSGCILVGNRAHGVFCYESSASIAGCTVSRNGGRGLYAINAPTKLTAKNSIITGNGDVGVYCSAASVSVLNCTILGNLISGVYVRDNTVMTVTNCIIAWNAGAGISGLSPATSKLVLRYNNVFSNRSPDTSQDINYSAGAVPGKYDLQEYPWFAANGYRDEDGWQEGDYHLLSTAGRWDPLASAWVSDPVDSPCIDRGDPNSPIGQEPYPHGGRINLGVYGGTAQASKSISPGPVCIQYPDMDFNHDCRVDQADLDLFLKHWLECNFDDPNACPPANTLPMIPTKP